jgi:hypothetical protein
MKMQMKKIKSTFLAAMVTAALCAGTVSGLQLRNHAATSTFCGGLCNKHVACPGDCFCNISGKERFGSCINPPSFRPAK